MARRRGRNIPPPEIDELRQDISQSRILTLDLSESSRQVAAEGKFTFLDDPSYPHLITSGLFGRSAAIPDAETDIMGAVDADYAPVGCVREQGLPRLIRIGRLTA